ncbi:MAG: FecR family protein, partial [Tannerella sp.]|nr:FecR family protein [Tannerella sp.]
MATDRKNTDEAPDKWLDELLSETETPATSRPFAEMIRRIRVSPQAVAMGEAMKDDIRMELQRRIMAARRRTFRLQAASIAATVAMLLVISSYFSYRHGYRQTNRAIVEIKSPLGMQSSIVLSDGTKVRLNAGTILSYPAAFTEKKREVTISGEAFFEVAPDKKSPFTVHTDALDVRVLGTEFNVQ